jgi:outer membrane protein
VVKLFKVVMLAGFVLASSLAGAQAQGKIAVLDPRGAIFGTDEAKKRIKALEAQSEYQANVKQREALTKEFEGIYKQVQKDLAVMSAEQKEKEGKKLEAKRGEIEKVQRKLQASQQELTQGLMQEMEPKFKKAVTDLIKSENIGLLLDSGAAMHVDDSFNITSKVTDALNKAN